VHSITACNGTYLRQIFTRQIVALTDLHSGRTVFEFPDDAELSQAQDEEQGANSHEHGANERTSLDPI